MKYDKKRIDILIQALELGHNRKDACILAKITQETFAQWLKDKRKPEFSVLILQAELKSTDQAVKSIRRAFKDEWKSAAWWLERKRPKEYGIRHTINGEIEHKVNLDVEAAKRAEKYED